MDIPISFDEGRLKGIQLVKSAKERSEISVVEYKEKPHQNNERCELLKDVIALLNAYDVPGGPRFLIYGVEDTTRSPIGVPKADGSIRRDSEFQQLFNSNIEPRPIFEFHDIDAHYIFENIPEGERWFGIFYFSEDNFGKIYKVKKDCRDKDKNSSSRSRSSLKRGQSFVRIGSSTKELEESDISAIRRCAQSLIENRRTKYTGSNGLTMPIDWRLLFVGGWCENDIEDILFLEQITSSTYERLITPVKESAVYGEGYLTYGKNAWSVVDRQSSMQKACNQVTFKDLEDLKDPIVNALSDIDEKFDLPSEKRIMASIYKKGPKYSITLRQGIAEGIACLANNPQAAPMCTKTQIESFASSVVWNVLQTDDWRVLASAGDYLPLLAEASPATYLNAISRSIEQGDAVKDYLNQSEGGIFETAYGASLIWGIAAAARRAETFSSAVCLLVSLLDYSPHAADALKTILLPWCPQTNASVEARKGCGKYLCGIGTENAWKTLIALLPNITTNTYCIYQPQFLVCENLPEFVPASEFVAVSRAYLEGALDFATGDTDKVDELVKHVGSFAAVDMVEDLANWLCDMQCALGEEARYSIWCSVKKAVDRQRAFSEADWSLSDDQLACLEKSEEAFRPNDSILLARRLFSAEYFELIHGMDWETQRDDLNVQRRSILEQIYRSGGIEGIEHLLSFDVKQSTVGAVSASCSFEKEIYGKVLDIVSSESQYLAYAKAFLLARYNKGATRLETAFVTQGNPWNLEAIAEYFSAFPCCENVWTAAEEILGSSNRLYWEKVNITHSDVQDTQLDHYVNSLNSVKRFGESVQELGRCLYAGIMPNPSLIYETLEGYSPVTSNEFAIHFIDKLLEYLEETQGDRTRLYHLEWRYFAALEDRTDAAIYKTLAESPGRFVEMLQIATRDDIEGLSDLDEDTRDRLSRQAYSVLGKWKIQPGLHGGTIDGPSFELWIAKVSETLPEHLADCAWRLIGANLFHSPASSNGFFIDETVAAFLNSNAYARRGYKTESINSRGMVWVDKTGSNDDALAAQYEVKAKSAESAGYIAFGATLRSIASSFHQDAQRIRDEPWD